MKARVKVDVGSFQVDEVLEGASEAEIVHKLRRQVEARAPFLVRPMIKSMDDRSLWRKVVEMHNQNTRASEPIPGTPEEFFAFGERVGYVTRLG